MKTIAYRLGSLAAGLCILAGAAGAVRADSPAGTDALGTPSIPIASGGASLVAGAGLHTGAGTIKFKIHPRATVNQALLYWGRHTTPDLGSLGATDILTVNGSAIVGERIGGPTLFFGSTSFASYRADITGLVSTGQNKFDITAPAANANRDLFAYDGAGVFVIFTPKKGPGASIQLTDGQDMAFFQFAPPLDTTVPQVYSFPSADEDRTADVNMFVGSVSSKTCNPLRGTPRPNVIETTSGGVTTAWLDFLGSDVGCEFDTLTFPVEIPAGSTSLAVQLKSACSSPTNCPSPNLPASMAWIVGAASVPNVEVNNRMTGGGSIFGADGQRITHGFQLRCDATDVPQSLEINWGGNRFHLEQLTFADCTNDPKIRPEPPRSNFDTYHGIGTGRYNGAPGATAEWIFKDAGEPGVNDTMQITIRDAGGNIVLQASAPLTFGNHQAH